LLEERCLCATVSAKNPTRTGLGKKQNPRGKRPIIVIVIIIIIILVITCTHDIYNYIPETNHVSWVYSVAAVLHLQFVLHVKLFRP
jgi:hypothetical protein